MRKLRSDFRVHTGPSDRTDRVGGVSRTRKPAQIMDPAQVEQAAQAAAAFLAGQQITTTDCRRCGSHIAGVNGRYACGACGWTNHWSEGSRELPPMEPADTDQ